MEASIFICVVLLLQVSVMMAVYSVTMTWMSVAPYACDTASAAWDEILRWAKQTKRFKVCLVLLLCSKCMVMQPNSNFACSLNPD